MNSSIDVPLGGAIMPRRSRNRDQAYLIKRPGGGWAFCIAIPLHLRASDPLFKSSTGKSRSKIIEGLGTDSLMEARKLRDRRLAFWQLMFDPIMGFDAPEPAAKPARPSRPVIPSDGRLSFSAAAELHLQALCRDPAAAPRQQTVLGQRAIHVLFASFVNDAPLATITRAQANDFLTHIGTARGLSNRSVNKYAITLAGVFRWARDAGKFDTTNPFERRHLRVARDAGWVPFTPEEVAKLVPVVPSDPLGWCILISLWSGMRLNECAGLAVADIRQVENVWVFDVRENSERRLKTPAATRLIPIHSKLIEVGLLDYAQTRSAGPLFDVTAGGPDKKPGTNLGQEFTRYRRSRGVERPRVSFHSWRKNFTSALDRAGVPIADASALLGHGRGFSWDIYSSGPGIARLRDLVEKVAY
jgi:integrase